MPDKYHWPLGHLLVLLLLVFGVRAGAQESDGWSKSQRRLLESLSLKNLAPPPADPSNSVADDPVAAAFGRKLFFDTRLSAQGRVACASCHQPGRYFTDGRGQARGIAATTRGAPTLLGASYNAWYFWDGRRDSQWSQALGPLENAREHGSSRTELARLVAIDPAYRATYQALFGSLPDLADTRRFATRAGPSSERAVNDAWNSMSGQDRNRVTRVFVNIGKSLAAYQRRLVPSPTRFDAYVEALRNNDRPAMAVALNPREVAGLKLFIGKAMCVRCHNGPLFTDHDFHNIGVPFARDLRLDWGRYQGVQKALQDEFNCLSEYSDADPSECTELRFVKTLKDETLGAFKTPTLRNVAATAPYMHSGQFTDLDTVLAHYNKTTASRKAAVGHSDLLPINLTPRELTQLKAFLPALGGAPTIGR